ncbi:hypothetical protein ON010_g9095 [Phytophthora cinnamomi]|nr:hypothetical protein ON010_g9095 [Phytophthora cinnamomi]
MKRHQKRRHLVLQHCHGVQRRVRQELLPTLPRDRLVRRTQSHGLDLVQRVPERKVPRPRRRALVPGAVLVPVSVSSVAGAGPPVLPGQSQRSSVPRPFRRRGRDLHGRTALQQQAAAFYGEDPIGLEGQRHLEHLPGGRVHI